MLPARPRKSCAELDIDQFGPAGMLEARQQRQTFRSRNEPSETIDRQRRRTLLTGELTGFDLVALCRSQSLHNVIDGHAWKKVRKG